LDRYAKKKSLKADELLHFFYELGIDENDEELLERIKDFDDNENGMIDRNEFFSLLLNQLRTGETDEEVVEAFKVFDKDGTGFINASDIRHIMTHLGDKLSDDEVDTFIRMADLDGDGHINYEEFTKIMMDKLRFYEENLFKGESES